LWAFLRGWLAGGLFAEVALGSEKKLEAGFVATRWGRFEVLVDL
jgi:hypothetical protein